MHDLVVVDNDDSGSVDIDVHSPHQTWLSVKNGVVVADEVLVDGVLSMS